MIATLVARNAIHLVRPVATSAASVSSASSKASTVILRRAFAAKTEPAAPDAAAGPTMADMSVKPCPDDEVPSILEQGTGLERAEIEYPDLFRHNEVIRGAFGTEKNPVKIQSMYDERIVGCTGLASPEDHDLMWIKVEKGIMARCPLCDQRFVLDPL